MTAPVSSPAPGWYPDPTGPLQNRWWDGTAWTEHTQPLPPPAPHTAAPTGWSTAGSHAAVQQPDLLHRELPFTVKVVVGTLLVLLVLLVAGSMTQA